MAVFDRIEKLKREYTDKYVVVDASRPELTRFHDRTGQIKTINMNGQALVQFDLHNDIGWYDIALDFLKVVDRPPPKAEEKKGKPAAEAPASTKVGGATPVPEGKAAPGGTKKASTADILAAARAKKENTPAANPTAGVQPPGSPAAPKSKPSTAEILAAARAKAGGAAPTAKEPAPGAAATPAAPASKPAAPAGGKLSTADILAAARGKAAPAAPKAPAVPPAAPAPPEAAEEAPKAPATELAQQEVIEETPAAAAKASGASGAAKGDLPNDTAGKIAWCRQHDAK